jgi:hypothetical protein
LSSLPYPIDSILTAAADGRTGADDSSSMKREGRWESQQRLVTRIAQITTRMLPENDGIDLRFINQDVENSNKLTLQGIYGTMESASWIPGADSTFGRYLKSKILEPRVYAKLRSKTLESPLLVTMITDGMPEGEVNSAFANVVIECGNRLEDAGYPRDSEELPGSKQYPGGSAILLTHLDCTGVKFMVCQVGTSQTAAEFLEALRIHPAIAGSVYCTTSKHGQIP